MTERHFPSWGECSNLRQVWQEWNGIPDIDFFHYFPRAVDDSLLIYPPPPPPLSAEVSHLTLSPPPCFEDICVCAEGPQCDRLCSSTLKMSHAQQHLQHLRRAGGGGGGERNMQLEGGKAATAAIQDLQRKKVKAAINGGKNCTHCDNYNIFCLLLVAANSDHPEEDSASSELTKGIN